VKTTARSYSRRIRTLAAIRKNATTKARMITYEVRENIASLLAGRGEKILIGGGFGAAI
jgi:hypothetical protein